MRVKDLIKALEKADLEAMICVEANDGPIAKMVVQYTFSDGDVNLYIADNTDYLDEVNENGEYVIWRDCAKREELYKEEEYDI